MKTCSKCREVKPLIEFNKNKSTKDGMQSHCKKCRKEDAAKWHVEHKEQAAKRSASYQARNPEKCKERRKKYAIDNKAAIAEMSKIYREKFGDKLNLKSKAWRDANKDRCRAYAGRWREENKEAIKAYFRLHKVDHRKYSRIYMKQASNNLADSYVRGAISRRSGVSCGDIPQELIQAKRIHLQLVRKIKELRA